MRALLPPLAALALVFAACQPPSSRLESAPVAQPLPSSVRGANIRPVGDRRRGYGTVTARRTMQRLRGMGMNTLAILMEGRMSSGADTEVRVPTREDLEATRKALLDANALGFATILIPHLYIDDGTYRGHLTFEDAEDAADWWASYQAFIEQAASVAQTTGTTVLSVGVELKAMSRDPSARPHMATLVRAVRRQFEGLLTYSANWDEGETVQWWDLIDVAGVNGYYPLVPEPIRGSQTIARRLTALAERANRPVLVLEVGYRSSPIPHARPWEWPDQVAPTVDHAAQAQAWASVLTHWLDAEGVRGLLVWVVPSDPDDPAAEPPHGFSPMNKPAEEVIARVFRRARGRE